jgi:hypothetical protein
MIQLKEKTPQGGKRVVTASTSNCHVIVTYPCGPPCLRRGPSEASLRHGFKACLIVKRRLGVLQALSN